MKLIREKYSKRIVVMLGATIMCKPIAMSTNLLYVNAFATERNQSSGNITVFTEGTVLVAAAKVTVSDTVSSTVEKTTTAEITLNKNIEVSISEHVDFEYQGFIMRDALETNHVTINVDINVDGLTINKDVERKDGAWLYENGWDIYHDFIGDTDKFEDHVLVTVRTKKFSFEVGEKTYTIDSFEYSQDVDLLKQGEATNYIMIKS